MVWKTNIHSVTPQSIAECISKTSSNHEEMIRFTIWIDRHSKGLAVSEYSDISPSYSFLTCHLSLDLPFLTSPPAATAEPPSAGHRMSGCLMYLAAWSAVHHWLSPQLVQRPPHSNSLLDWSSVLQSFSLLLTPQSVFDFCLLVNHKGWSK